MPKFTHVLYVLGGTLCIVAIWFIIQSLPLRVDLTRAQFDRVATGMTREEVIKITGVPPGNYSNKEYAGCAEAHRGEGWVIPEYELIVKFDDNEVATEVKILPAVRFYHPPLFEQLLDSLGFR